MKFGPLDAEFSIDTADFDVVHIELRAGKLRLALGVDAATASVIGNALTRCGKAARNRTAHFSSTRVAAKLLKRARR